MSYAHVETNPAHKHTEMRTKSASLNLSSANPLLPYMQAHKAGQEWTVNRVDCKI